MSNPTDDIDQIDNKVPSSRIPEYPASRVPEYSAVRVPENAGTQPAEPLLKGETVRAGLSFTWGMALCLLFLYALYFLLGAVRNIITPFALGIVFALLLEPLVNLFTRRVTNGKYMRAVNYVFLLFLIGFGAIIGLVLPHLISQSIDFVQHYPKYFDQLRDTTDKWLLTHRTFMGVQLPPDAATLGRQYSGQVSEALRTTGQRLIETLRGSAGTILGVALSPLVTFYVLSDLPRMRARLFYILPEKIRADARRHSLTIGQVFGNYIRGLMTISVIYAVTVTTVILLASIAFPGLRGHAVLIGALGGLCYTIPMLGPPLAATISAVVTLATGNPIPAVAVAGGSILVMNALFDNLVQPRIVGGSVGLHPLVSMFSLLLGEHLFGLPGMLLSIPMAASIQVALFEFFPRMTAPIPIGHFYSRDQAARRRIERREHPTSTVVAPDAGNVVVE